MNKNGQMEVRRPRERAEGHDARNGHGPLKHPIERVSTDADIFLLGYCAGRSASRIDQAEILGGAGLQITRQCQRKRHFTRVAAGPIAKPVQIPVIL